MKDENTDPLVLICVHEGRAWVEERPPGIQVIIRDYDALENGLCPECGDDLTTESDLSEDETWCPTCGRDWSDA